jgi:superfamily II DNA or RNA helicase
MSYKYIIFCIFKENIDLLNTFLSRYIESSLIGVIRGDTSADERKQIASDYDEGIKKIVILSKAGEEGVDFKRTGVIILADGVWTSAEYDQILGRAVRKNSNLRLRDNKDDPTLDPNTLIPDKIECISILLTTKYQQNPSDIIKYSGDLRQFKIILTKRAITKQVIDELQPYFYKMIDVVDKTESTLPIGTPNSATINELSIPNTLYDGIRKTKSKSRRRSTRRKSKSKRRRKSKSKRRSTRRKSKSKRRRKSKSKRRSTRRKSKY